jgi:hypothetical protein
MKIPSTPTAIPALAMFQSYPVFLLLRQRFGSVVAMNVLHPELYLHTAA